MLPFPNERGENAKGLRLFRRESCLSYAVYDRGAGVAAWIDADQAHG